ncbi:magnesium transporter [Pseudomonas boanensis]|uniref:magnesium transporter n=1 Tax=Metapseudomonas boanensis TaxID=2822138 RepID=UPI0035D47C3E
MLLDTKVARERISFETAAQHATTRIPVFPPDRLVGDARVTLMSHHYDCASHIMVCEDQRFLGLVRIEDLLGAPADAALDGLMDRDAPTVTPHEDQEIAAWRAVRHGESALTVVDANGRLVGVIPPHRLLAVLLWEHEEDLTRLGGFIKGTESARTSSEEPVERRFQHRIPWLLVGLIGALLAANFVERFQNQLESTLMLAFFLPGIVYLADAVGTQTETVVVRGLSVGASMGQMLRREILVGLAIGLTLALVAGPLVWWIWGATDVALCVGLAVFAACGTATLAAMALPWLLSTLSLDPAFGSGPLATVVQDLLSILIYFAIASVLI